METKTRSPKLKRPTSTTDKPLTARDILALPREQQDALLEAAADYNNNPKLTIVTRELATDDFHSVRYCVNGRLLDIEATASSDSSEVFNSLGSTARGVMLREPPATEASPNSLYQLSEDASVAGGSLSMTRSDLVAIATLSNLKLNNPGRLIAN